MSNLQDQIDSCVSQLTGPSSDDAWHTLVEIGPCALPLLADAFVAFTEVSFRLALVSVASEYRVDEAVPLLETALADDDPRLWQAALDGLVTVGSKLALESLVSARQTAGPDQAEWIDEAIEQVQERGTPI